MWNKMRILLFVVLATVIVAGQSDPWAALRAFEGRWEGAATGIPGKGVSTREYRFELNGRFLVARNQSVYEPKSPNVNPEVHEDLGIFSYDRALQKVVLRQFHSEGFVNEYVLDSASADNGILEFVTVKIENISPGWRAKEAYRFVSSDEVIETFSLAAPGKDFEVYSETRLKRVR